jgi:hypothetical protein
MNSAAYSIEVNVLQVQEPGCALTAWHIARGSIGDVDVSGLNLVAALFVLPVLFLCSFDPAKETVEAVTLGGLRRGTSTCGTPGRSRAIS